jgi:hypothetical protein
MIEFYQVSTNYKKVSFSPFVIVTELFLKHKVSKYTNINDNFINIL